MTDDGFVLGVDLGTSHTVAVLRHPDGRVRPLLFDGQPLLPSAVYLDTTGRLHVGRDALRLGLAEPDRVEPNPKRRIDDGTALLGNAEVPVADLLAALLGAVAREAVAITGQLPPAVLTHPASWGASRRAILTEALAKAGWPGATRLVPEPVAAARYFAGVLRRPVPVGSSLAVFDFGGGTLDIAVVRNDGGHYTVTASGGADDLGGLDVDAALVDHLAKSLSAAEPEAWQALHDPRTLGQWRARRQFWEDVRGAKEMLSRSSFAPLPVPGIEQALHVTRDELEAAADPLVRRGVAEAADVIAATGLAPSDLAGLFLVGGSSRVPLVARLLHAELGIAPTVLEQPELPVAEGSLLTDPPTPRFSQGVAEAATPTPTPPTIPAVSPEPAPDALPTTAAAISPAGPSAGAAPAAAAGPAATTGPSTGEGTDDRVYVEAVDPWATAEAAAIAAGGPAFPVSGSGYQQHTPAGPGGPMTAMGLPGEPPAPPKPGRRRLFVLIAAATAVILVAAGAAVWFLRPRYPALDYRSSLPDALHITPKNAVGSDFSDAEVIGDRAYFATAQADGSIEVIAADAGSGKVQWDVVGQDKADRWTTMYALSSGVALYGDTATSGEHILSVLGAKKGAPLLSRQISADEQARLIGGKALIADEKKFKLTAYNSDGKQAWEINTPHTDYEGKIDLYSVTTPKDLSGPSTTDGRPLAPDDGDDTRAVMIGPDKSATVIDLDDGGKTLATRAEVADSSDGVVAHNGRLFVAEYGTPARVVVYGLDKLAQPQEIYRTQSSNAQLLHMTPCGDDQICFVEGSSDKSDVVAVPADGKTGGWRVAVPSVDTLVPVGAGVLASTSSKTTLIDGKGKKLWDNEAAAGRIDARNVLAFRQSSPYPADAAITGQHLGDDPVSIGTLGQVRGDTCSWNKSMLACVGDKDFMLVKYVK